MAAGGADVTLAMVLPLKRVLVLLYAYVMAVTALQFLLFVINNERHDFGETRVTLTARLPKRHLPVFTQNQTASRRVSAALRNVSDRRDALAQRTVPNVATTSKAKASKAKPTKRYSALDPKFFKKRATKVNKWRYDFAMTGSAICSPETKMAILVHSATANKRQRNVLRQTWGTVAAGGAWPDGSDVLNAKLAFVLGLPNGSVSNESLHSENAEYGDLVQGNFIDTYFNMTLKSLLGLRWVSSHCRWAKYVLKTDEDMFINLPALTHKLQSVRPKRSVAGPHCPRSAVYRQGKWGVSVNAYPFSYYPPYEAGSAYVITVDVVEDLWTTAEYLPSFHVDDAYITGVVGMAVGLRHLHWAGFAYWGTKHKSICDIKNGVVLTEHNTNEQRLRTIWNELRTKKCK